MSNNTAIAMMAGLIAGMDRMDAARARDLRPMSRINPKHKASNKRKAKRNAQKLARRRQRK